jgi:hypothetical protein
MVCAFCGSSLLPRARFCVQCGHRTQTLAPPAPAPQKGGAPPAAPSTTLPPPSTARPPAPNASQPAALSRVEPVARAASLPPAKDTAPLSTRGPASLRAPVSIPPEPATLAQAQAALDAIDEGFAAFFEEMPHATPAPPAAHESDVAEVRALFEQVLIANARPVRELGIELSWGDLPKLWIDVAIPTLSSLSSAARQLELSSLANSLDAFARACEAARAGGSDLVEGSTRTTLLSEYERLIEAHRPAFELRDERVLREGVIVQSVLRQVRDVGKVTLDKLFAAGLTSLEAYRLAKPGDIATTTGIPIELATRIADRFHAYRIEAASWRPTDDRRDERALLSQLARELQALQVDLDAASRGWTTESVAKKRRLTAQRGETLLRAQVVLAHLGETKRLAELERAPIAAKIALLEELGAKADEAAPSSLAPMSLGPSSLGPSSIGPSSIAQGSGPKTTPRVTPSK